MTTPAKNPVAAAVGAAFLASVALAPLAQAAENPFQANSLSGGYTLAEKTTTEGKCGEGKCGEGKCGGSKAAPSAGAEGDAAGSGE